MVHRRQDSCFNCKGPSGEDVSGGFYEAGGSFLKLGIVEAFTVRTAFSEGVPFLLACLPGAAHFIPSLDCKM